MASLDVSDALLAWEFNEAITVRRRVETVSSSGRGGLTLQDIAANAVVTPGPSDELRIEADKTLALKSISVITRFRLRGPAFGYQPDLVIWHGDAFKVVRVGDASNWGIGFIEAECESIDPTDIPAA